MNRKAIILLVISLLPPFIFLGYYLFSSVFDNRTPKEVFLEIRKNEKFNFKIDSIYRDSWNHNTLTMKGKKNIDIATSERTWENIFKVNDSIVKQTNSSKIYLYRNKKLDTILDYNNIQIIN